MIVVKVELWPHGDAERAAPLGVLAIRNSGPVGGRDLYKYEVELQEKGRSTYRHLTHYRRRGWLHLIKLALESLDG